MEDHSDLERRLGVSFVCKDLLRLALVHSSYPNENPGAFSESNERLEFLGDAVIGAVVAEHLFRRNPGWSEGELTHVRSTLVSGEALSAVASRMELGRYLYLGRGEEAAGGRDRRNNLAAALEAVVGALFIDQGYESARDFVAGAVLSEMDQGAGGSAPLNAKSALQEAAQSQGKPPPSYRIVHAGGPDHAPVFTAEVSVDGKALGQGAGARKGDAERAAAAQALEALGLESR